MLEANMNLSVVGL